MPYLIYVYTLLLENGYYYVGRTRNLDRRKDEHFCGQGSEWTKLHPPVKTVHTETFLVSSTEEEDRWENHQTIKMMKTVGWQNVRGGFWCYCGELETLLGLQHHGYFIDVDKDDVAFQTREQIIYLLRLEQEKYFAGSTRSLKLAVDRHEKGKSCEWTRKYPPVELIRHQTVVYEDGLPTMDALNDLVIEYGREYGYENIRGGNFNSLDDAIHLRHIQSFITKRNRKRDITLPTSVSTLLSDYKDANGGTCDCDIILSHGEALYYVYALELQDGFYHISCVRDVDKILSKIERGKGGQWCTLHPPVRLVEVIPVIGSEKCMDINQVDPVVERYFNLYGAVKVRGGRFVSPDPTVHMKNVNKHYNVVDNIYSQRSERERTNQK